MYSFRQIALFALGLTALGSSLAAEPKLAYPNTRHVDHADDYHGTTVADPYRWLEDDARTSADVAAWVEAENTVTFAYLESIPERESIKQRLTRLWNYERYNPPFKVGGRYYYSKNDGLQNQNVIYMMDSLDGEPRVLFDPNAWSKDGTVALTGTSFSDDGRYAAYAIAEAGSDWQKWRIRDIDAGADLPDVIDWVKFSGAVWTMDSKGFFYGRYDEPKADSEGQFHAVNKFQKLYYHRVGTPQSQDVLVYHRPDEPDWGFGASATEDGRYLVITVSKGTADKYRVMVKDLAEPYGLPVDLIDNFDAEYSVIGNDGPLFYFKTDLDAPRGRVIAIDLRKPTQEHWKELIPQSDDTLQGVNLVGNLFVASYLRHAVTAVRLFDVAGNHVRDVEFPGIGTAGALAHVDSRPARGGVRLRGGHDRGDPPARRARSAPEGQRARRHGGTIPRREVLGRSLVQE